MTATLVHCVCGEPMRPDANFCARCGCELLPTCPICFEERRLLARHAPGASPWCNRGSALLFACNLCGRWLTPDVQQCPDPGCQGKVGPTWPVATGRTADGTGNSGTWRWPAAWDTRNPQYVAPRIDLWESEDPVHAAWIAHGQLYVWTGTRLRALLEAPGGPLAEPDNRGLRCWLGHKGVPDPALLLRDRVSVLGGVAVLAAQDDFLVASLYPYCTEDTIRMDVGTPVTQIAAEGWWVGWSRRNAKLTLWLAPVPVYWRNLEWQQITGIPSEAVPGDHASLVLHNGLACWIGQDSALWQLDCRSRTLQRITDPLPGARQVWHATEGWHSVRTTDQGIRVGLDAVARTGAVREVSGGTGPLRDLFASPALLAIVDDRVTALDPHSGTSIGGGKYSGQWISGLFAKAQPDAVDQEPRLLMLTREGDQGSLSVLRLSSGVEEPLWKAAGARPLALIPAGERLYVVHERGVTRIQEALP